MVKSTTRSESNVQLTAAHRHFLGYLITGSTASHTDLRCGFQSGPFLTHVRLVCGPLPNIVNAVASVAQALCDTGDYPSDRRGGVLAMAAVPWAPGRVAVLMIDADDPCSSSHNLTSSGFALSHIVVHNAR